MFKFPIAYYNDNFEFDYVTYNISQRILIL